MSTPLREQYLKIKGEYPDAILLFRLGDFYETFDDDAKVAARDLDITLTGRDMGKGDRVPMAGIPHHALEAYLGRLINSGHVVAICEQLSEPTTGKGLVDRGVVRVVTPGTLTEPSLLETSTNNYLGAVIIEDDNVGLSYTDITTSEFVTAQLTLDQLPQEIARLSLAEVIFPVGTEFPRWMASHARMTPLETKAFNYRTARQKIMHHFGVTTLEAYGCEGLPLATQAAGAIVDYLEHTQSTALTRLTHLQTYWASSYMLLDVQTRRNLELFEGGRWGSRALSLLSVLDLTRTPMGARLLRKWLGQPLLDLPELERRQGVVSSFYTSALCRERMRDSLSRVSDMERLLNRIGSGTANPRDLVGLRLSLETVPQLESVIKEMGAEVTWLTDDLFTCDETVEVIRDALEDEPTGEIGQGTTIRAGFSDELDELRNASRNARDFIAGLERQERNRTGIGNLKVGYNKVFGYYIEVSNSNLPKVPSDYMRRQTLVGGERFITPELKEYESLILNARERIEKLELNIFRRVCDQILAGAFPISRTAYVVALMDSFCSLAEAASRHGYTRPSLDESDIIDIKAGRHPVVEQNIPPGTFVPNDTNLSTCDNQLGILTGPNMAGKSTYIRQVALIVLMAQIGSFVPAESASIGLVDRIFTRVGLQDDLATGQSTFMVEMVETANILHHATTRSLVILDEIGRGTSTYDGLAIARSVVEHLHNAPLLGCRTLFATHYHELTELASVLPRIRNFNVAVSEQDGEVTFLHRIVPGAADRSYGVHVAKLAGLPRSIVKRAWEVLESLENNGHRPRTTGHGLKRRPRKRSDPQMALFGAPESLMEELLRIDVSSITPLESITRLYELQKRARELGENE